MSDYNTIKQIEVTESGLVLKRLGHIPKGAIKVKLRFRDEGN